MEGIRDVMLEHFQARMEFHTVFMAFAQKVISVLIAEALSTTVGHCVHALYPSGKPLLRHSIYCGLILLYAPTAAWVITRKCRCSQGESFIAVSLRYHAKVCPILLAWAIKNWAAALDREVGDDVWDELIVALCLTLFVGGAEMLPCFNEAKKAVAAGADSDTLRARFASIPAACGLALGYAWNAVATPPVTHAQKEFKNYEDRFAIQAMYALITGVVATVMIRCLSMPPAKNKSDIEKAQGDKTDDGKSMGHVHTTDWSGQAVSTWRSLVSTILSFIYAWAFLDAVDDWAFGVIENCASPFKCSFQVNFEYSLVVTVFFVAGAAILEKCKQWSDSPTFKQAISLQLNAMSLTVGWAWMNFYTVFMHVRVKRVSNAMGVLMYFQVLVVIFVFTNMINFILNTIDVGMQRSHKNAIARLTEMPKAISEELHRESVRNRELNRETVDDQFDIHEQSNAVSEHESQKEKETSI